MNNQKQVRKSLEELGMWWIENDGKFKSSKEFWLFFSYQLHMIFKNRDLNLKGFQKISRIGKDINLEFKHADIFTLPKANSILEFKNILFSKLEYFLTDYDGNSKIKLFNLTAANKALQETSKDKTDLIKLFSDEIKFLNNQITLYDKLSDELVGLPINLAKEVLKNGKDKITLNRLIKNNKI